MRETLTIAALLTIAPAALAANSGHDPKSPYAGQQHWEIKSLSPDDIAELRRGGGWGLARSAELNGVPGPAHLLELKEQIPLDAAQVGAITALYEEMKRAAVAEGENLILLEQDLERAFSSGRINDAILQQLLRAISESRMRLRYIHLATHLRTPDILSATQIARYNELRGYVSNDPCSQVPEGHNPAMWRQHNGCE